MIRRSTVTGGPQRQTFKYEYVFAVDNLRNAFLRPKLYYAPRGVENCTSITWACFSPPEYIWTAHISQTNYSAAGDTASC